MLDETKSREFCFSHNKIPWISSDSYVKNKTLKTRYDTDRKVSWVFINSISFVPNRENFPAKTFTRPARNFRRSVHFLAPVDRQFNYRRKEFQLITQRTFRHSRSQTNLHSRNFVLTFTRNVWDGTICRRLKIKRVRRTVSFSLWARRNETSHCQRRFILRSIVAKVVEEKKVRRKRRPEGEFQFHCEVLGLFISMSMSERRNVSREHSPTYNDSFMVSSSLVWWIN